MVRIEGLKLAPGQDERLLRGKAARLLRVPEGDILSLQVLRRAIDAREELHFVYTAAVTLRQEKAALRRVRDRRVTPYTPEVYRLPETLAAPRRRRWSSGPVRGACSRPLFWPGAACGPSCWSGDRTP